MTGTSDKVQRSSNALVISLRRIYERCFIDLVQLDEHDAGVLLEAIEALENKPPQVEAFSARLANFSVSQFEAEKAFERWQEKTHVARGTQAAFAAGWHARSTISERS